MPRHGRARELQLTRNEILERLAQSPRISRIFELKAGEDVQAVLDHRTPTGTFTLVVCATLDQVNALERDFKLRMELIYVSGPALDDGRLEYFAPSILRG